MPCKIEESIIMISEPHEWPGGEVTFLDTYTKYSRAGLVCSLANFHSLFATFNKPLICSSFPQILHETHSILASRACHDYA